MNLPRNDHNVHAAIPPDFRAPIASGYYGHGNPYHHHHGFNPLLPLLFITPFIAQAASGYPPYPPYGYYPGYGYPPYYGSAYGYPPYYGYGYRNENDEWTEAEEN